MTDRHPSSREAPEVEPKQSANLLSKIVELVDAMLAPFDVVELSNELVRVCLDVLPAQSAGILLHDQRGSLRVLASSSEDSLHLELLELQHAQGACFEAFRTGELVIVEDLVARVSQWPAFATAAIDRGISAVYAVPMRLRERRIGALNLFCTDHVRLDAEHLQIAGVLTKMATLGIINQRFVHEQEVLAQQLQSALQSRVLIEQAKGVLAERDGLDMAAAFAALRSRARSEHRLLSAVASEIVSGSETSRHPEPQPDRPSSATWQSSGRPYG